MASLRELGEIEVLRRLIDDRTGGSGVVVGPGDDAAVLEPTPGHSLVVTTDSFVEGAHYLTAWSDPVQIGTRLAAAHLSDLAAMAARPRWALLAIGARPDSMVDSLIGLQRGAGDALARHGAVIVGGNLTAVPGTEWLTLTLLGEAASGRAWRRGGARPGDLIAVTGFPGRAGAAVALVRRIGDQARDSRWRPLLAAWLEPEPRVALALELAAAGGVTAAIDVSDGLGGDLAQLCAASAVGAELLPAEAPDALIDDAARALGVTPEKLRLGPSDDYELLLTIDPEKRGVVEEIARSRAVPLAIIGSITARRGVLAIREVSGETRPLEASGYDPFGRSDV